MSLSRTFCLLALTSAFSCGTLCAETDLPETIASGGVAGDGMLCPSAPNDTIIDVRSLAAPDVDQPVMTISGLKAFIERNKITRIDQLMRSFPDHFKTNFSLVEHTRATGQSNLDYPRIVIFSSDGHLLMNIGTLREDPKFDMLDIAELHTDTGRWEFSVFDFSGPAPKLKRDDPECLSCHAPDNPRPIWGTNLLWPGVFGDNIAEGPQGEALDTGHAIKFNQFANQETDSVRMNTMIFRDEKVHRGGKRRIANHIIGSDLLISNIAFGSAAAYGAFRTIKTRYPERYQQLRQTLLILALQDLSEKPENPTLTQALKEQVRKYNIGELSVDQVLIALGLNPQQAFSLATLHDREAPQTDWQMGIGGLYEQLFMLVLDDLANDDPKIEALLQATAPGSPVFGCKDLAKTVRDMIDYKKLHLYQLRGRARYEVNRIYYAIDAEVINQQVLQPLVEPLGKLLSQQLNRSTAKL